MDVRPPMLLLVVCLSALAPAARAGPFGEAPWLDVPASDADRRHLLSRTGIGVAPDDYAALAGLTRREALERTLAGLRTAPTHPMPGFTRRPLPHYHAYAELDVAGRRAFDRARDAELAELRRWWTLEMLDTDSPQTERLVLLLHDLFATSVLGTNRSTLAMARQNATFRALHSGSWEVLLRAMLRDAALLEFLDAASNRAGEPNENLGRELLERFTLGDVEHAYDEGTVREAARALTGHAVQDVPGLEFRLRTWAQDRGDKTLFGVRGPHGADDLVRLVLARPAAARHLARVWWHAFVSDAPPDAGELSEIAARFRDSGHELAVLHRATLESEAFWRPANRAALVKSPVDLALGLARTLEYPKARVDGIATLLAGLGQSPFAPPDVGGWDEGAAWVAPGRLLARFAAADALAGDGGDADGGAASGTDGDAMAGAASGAMMSEGSAVSGESMMAGDEPSMVGGAPTTGADGDGLELRLASDALDGPVRIGVTLLADGAALWDSGVHPVPGGHDRARFGPIGASAGRAWRMHRLAAPADAVAAADEVRVRFVNDAADARGDRNLFVDSVRLGARRASAATGRQASACAPENPSDAGDLYCAGTLSVAFASPTPAAERPTDRLSAAAARLRWASVDADTGRLDATFVLEHVRAPAGGLGDRELVQFRLVGEPGPDGAPGTGLDLRLDSFDCRGPCVARWPSCAWTNERFPTVRGLSLTLGAAGAPGRECVERELDPGPAALLLALEGALPELVRRVADTEGARRHAHGYAALRARLDAVLGADAPGVPGGSSGSGDDAIAIDATWAPPPPAPDPPLEPRPRVASLDALVDALGPAGIDPIALLLPGIDGAAVDADPGAPSSARLRAVLDDPLFQLH